MSVIDLVKIEPLGVLVPKDSIARLVHSVQPKVLLTISGTPEFNHRAYPEDKGNLCLYTNVMVRVITTIKVYDAVLSSLKDGVFGSSALFTRIRKGEAPEAVAVDLTPTGAALELVSDAPTLQFPTDFDLDEWLGGLKVPDLKKLATHFGITKGTANAIILKISKAMADYNADQFLEVIVGADLKDNPFPVVEPIVPDDASVDDAQEEQEVDELYSWSFVLDLGDEQRFLNEFIYSPYLSLISKGPFGETKGMRKLVEAVADYNEAYKKFAAFTPQEIEPPLEGEAVINDAQERISRMQVKNAEAVKDIRDEIELAMDDVIKCMAVFEPVKVELTLEDLMMGMQAPPAPTQMNAIMALLSTALTEEASAQTVGTHLVTSPDNRNNHLLFDVVPGGISELLTVVNDHMAESVNRTFKAL